ncbi:S41 family peptidase [Flavobacterium sp.]|uniref:S41 family peptidase n=1 Tax=Flavobacterium sp. TaxID=239 RepID=UPI0037530C1F
MRNIIKASILFILTLTAIASCTDYDDEIQSPIQNFIWKGLNLYYLYQPQVPDLSDDKFSTQKNLDDFLSTKGSPENLFESLIYNRKNIDKYSVIFSNYVELEQILSGNSKSNGLEIGFTYKNTTTNEVFGFIKYVMPNSDASSKPIQRGTIFYGINGVAMTQDRTTKQNNFSQPLNNDTYTINLADYDNGNITPNGQSITFTKTDYSENPVFYKNVYTVGAKKVGYLIYNGFYSNYETELNNAFAYFKGEGVTDFVLDLRYNSGGSIDTATRLGSMITGQFAGQVFSEQQWNTKIQPQFSANQLQNLFLNTLKNGAALNSIGMTKVYILTTSRTASASELVMNCLKPYVNVVQIGVKTTGKNVGSITMYDSPNFSKKGANPNHTYAMQPIVLKTVNKIGFGDYATGIDPDISNILPENYGNLGQLGDVSEPLLAKALNLATLRIGNQTQNYKIYNEIFDNSVRDLDSEMYLDNYPEGLAKILK